MSFLVRKVTMSKWSVGDEVGPVNADAITQCLKTSGNTLSFWKVDSETDISQAVLAIVASNDNLDKIDVVIIDESIFVQNSIKVELTPGKTACIDLVDSHRDLAELNVHHLAIVSDAIADQIRLGKTSRYTLTKLREMLVAAIDSGRLNFDSLSLGVQRKVRPGVDAPANTPNACPTCGVTSA